MSETTILYLCLGTLLTSFLIFLLLLRKAEKRRQRAYNDFEAARRRNQELRGQLKR